MISPYTKIKTIIIDDEQLCIDSLQLKLEETCQDIEVLQTCTSVTEGLKAISNHKPQLIFLDINMPGEDGFTLLEKIDTPTFEIIFTTAYDQYALKAFQFNAINYLLKPISPEEIMLSINRYKERTYNQTSIQQLQSLLDDVRSTQKEIDKVALPTTNGYRFVLLKDIIRLEASSNYTIFYLTDQSQVVVSRTLKEYEIMLENHSFIRIHNSHLVNLSLIKEYYKGQGGTIIMADGTEIEVSARRRNYFLEKIEAFIK